MIQLILVLLLIQQGIMLLTKRKSNVLSCGIAGFIPHDKTKPLNTSKIKLLLMLNETRGKQSTGIFSKQGTAKKTDQASDFLKGINVTAKESDTYPHLLQTRAPSTGMNRTISAAQPVVITPTVDKPKTFGLVHNGTIHNMDDLAETYAVDVETTETDSQILAKIIKNLDYEVLNEYEGAASLIWYDEDQGEDALFVFRGESKKGQYATAPMLEERPLHMGVDVDGTWFSSTSEALEALFDTQEEKDTIQEIERNKIFKFTKDETKEVMKIDRTAAAQVKIVTYNKPKVNTPVIQNNKGGYSAPKNNKVKYDYDDEFVKAHIAKLDVLTPTKNVNHWLNPTIAGTVTVNIADEKINVSKLEANQVFWYKGQYRTRYNVASGILKLTEDGMLSSEGTAYRFYKGILLKPEIEYITVFNAMGKHPFGSQEFADEILPFTFDPILVVDSYNDVVVEEWENVNYTGITRFTPKFAERGILTFYSGYLSDITLYPVEVLSIGDTVTIKSAGTVKSGKVLEVDLIDDLVTYKHGGTRNVDNVDKIIRLIKKGTLPESPFIDGTITDIHEDDDKGVEAEKGRKAQEEKDKNGNKATEHTPGEDRLDVELTTENYAIELYSYLQETVEDLKIYIDLADGLNVEVDMSVLDLVDAMDETMFKIN